VSLSARVVLEPVVRNGGLFFGVDEAGVEPLEFLDSSFGGRLRGRGDDSSRRSCELELGVVSSLEVRCRLSTARTIDMLYPPNHSPQLVPVLARPLDMD
jgi:hypothetical protein